MGWLVQRYTIIQLHAAFLFVFACNLLAIKKKNNIVIFRPIFCLAYTLGTFKTNWRPNDGLVVMGCNYFSVGKIVLKTTLAKVCVVMLCKRGVLQRVQVVKDIIDIIDFSTCWLGTIGLVWGDTHLRSSRSSRPKWSHFTLKQDSVDNLAKHNTL